MADPDALSESAAGRAMVAMATAALTDPADTELVATRVAAVNAAVEETRTTGEASSLVAGLALSCGSYLRAINHHPADGEGSFVLECTAIGRPDLGIDDYAASSPRAAGRVAAFRAVTTAANDNEACMAILNALSAAGDVEVMEACFEMLIELFGVLTRQLAAKAAR